MALPGEEEMEEGIWTVRRRRHLGPCRTSLRTGRAWRSGEPDFPCPYFVTFLAGPSQIPLCSWFPCLLISVDFHSFWEPVVKHHFTCDQQVHTLSPKGRGCAPPPCPGCSVYVPTRILISCLQVAFFNDAGASAQEEQRVCCQPLAHPVASSQRTPGTGEQLYGGQGGPEGAWGETRALIHPPLGTDTIRKYTSQGAVPKMWHLERRTSSGWPRTRRCKSSWLSLTDSVEPAPGEAREGSPHHNPTAQQIVQLLPLTQDSPGAPRLGQQPLHAILFTVPRSGR
ncbi:golgin subfamily A member 2-like isoform X1 [Macaca nemestrina]|uniref:golgin subfamily A member 2-like isoform X1 n=1 Tax=Macaca nemestrina TaxID=9545 RepID=UPI0039B854D8